LDNIKVVHFQAMCEIILIVTYSERLQVKKSACIRTHALSDVRVFDTIFRNLVCDFSDHT